MRHILLSLMILCLTGPGLFSQSKAGEVATIYLTTPDLDSSLAVYEKLGFHKVASNTFPVHWAQVSDGSLLIMMRKDTGSYIGLTYYTDNLDRVVKDLEKGGVRFDSKPRGNEPLKKYQVRSPEGLNVVISNNLGAFSQPQGTTLLNMKPEDFGSAEKYPNARCGVFGEFAIPVRDLEGSLRFWQKLGFEAKAKMTEPYPHAILSDGLMIIGLHQTEHFDFPAVSYFGIGVEERVLQLKESGLSGFEEVPDANNVVFRTWEGQHLFLFSLGM